VNRRAFIGFVSGAAAVWSLGVRAQRLDRVHRIGVLSPFPPSPTGSNVDAFQRSLRELGYIEGRNVIFEFRHGNGRYDLLPELAAELVHLAVDVIFTSWGSPTALAAKNATQTTPVVFTGVGDAIGVGLVSSLSRPSGNVTGLTIISETTVGKQLELLKEAAPNITRVAVLSNPTNPAYGPVLKDVDIMGRTLGVQIVRVGAEDQSKIERALDTAMSERAGGLVVLRDPVFVNQPGLLSVVSRMRLPAIYGLREAVDGGGLMSYGPNLADMYRRAALYVDKILRGAKTGDLPVEQASRFELVINLKTAKARGLTVPLTR
jgi:putative ABC transport system substrate-binding protein